MNISVLKEPKAPNFHIVVVEGDIPLMVSQTLADIPDGMFSAVFDLAYATDEDALFHMLADAFKYSYVTGREWNAIEDWINDLDWLEASGYLVILENLVKIGLDSKDAAMFFNVLDFTVQEWTNGRHYDDFPTPPTPFHVVIPVKKIDLSKSIAILKSGGISDIDVINE